MILKILMKFQISVKVLKIEKRIGKFEETLHPSAAASGEERASNSFVYAILFALRFDVSEKLHVCN